jgi:hypothetical protein
MRGIVPHAAPKSTQKFTGLQQFVTSTPRHFRRIRYQPAMSKTAFSPEFVAAGVRLRTHHISTRMKDLTRILSAIERGDPGAAANCLRLVYRELHKPGQTARTR